MRLQFDKLWFCNELKKRDFCYSCGRDQIYRKSEKQVFAILNQLYCYERLDLHIFSHILKTSFWKNGFKLRSFL